MGNCLDREPVTWADDDGDKDDDGDDYECSRKAMTSEKPLKLLEKKQADEAEIPQKVGRADSSTVVRIKISKKQLAELLRRAKAKSLSPQDVMVDLMMMSQAESHENHGHHWRPVLHSIAEEPL